jgi:photosystem II CP47 chlorophyll apoprotein
MLLYELVVIDPTDPVFNPQWRQGCYVLGYSARLGVISSSYGWSLASASSSSSVAAGSSSSWYLEAVVLAHLVLSGLMLVSACWHWAYWDLDLYLESGSRMLVLDLIRVFGIHLMLASSVCLAFGALHVAGIAGPGIWTQDSFGIAGSVRAVKPVYSLSKLTSQCFGVIPSHHIGAGSLGLIISAWHISTRPGVAIYKLLLLSNIETSLASSIASVLFAALLSSGSTWYGSAVSLHSLLGPTRYHWDNAYFTRGIDRFVSTSTTVAAQSHSNIQIGSNWQDVPDKMVLYDYIGSNPAKGGLFRQGPIVLGDGVVQAWLGHSYFYLGTQSITVRRMPAFFETFPVILIDQAGTVKADIAFRRGASLYSVEQVGVSVAFSGGVLNGAGYGSSGLVKSYARKSQFGEILTFNKSAVSRRYVDGVFRTGARGWYTFTHTTLGILFVLGHLWHAGRALYRDIWSGVTIAKTKLVEYGLNEKLGYDTKPTATGTNEVAGG